MIGRLLHLYALALYWLSDAASRLSERWSAAGLHAMQKEYELLLAEMERLEGK